MKRILLFVLALVVILSAVLLVRGYQFKSNQKQYPPLAKVALDETALAERLAGAIRCATISHYLEEKTDTKSFQDMHALMRKHFPKTFSTLKAQTIGKFGLLLEWPGRDASLKPALLLAHQDVVPIAPGTEKDWTHPPFNGVTDKDFIWGRGTLDDKASLWGILEAVEKKLSEGFAPTRTIYFGFGDDEEVGGKRGAGQIALALKAKNVEFESVLDEGGVLGEGLLPEVAAPVAFIGIAEKGYTSVEMIAREKPAHSSTPPPPERTAIGRVAKAIVKLQAHPFPAKLEGPMHRMLQAVGPEMSFKSRVALANLWLLSPVVLHQLAEAPSANAAIRTSIAPTIFQAGEKDNILPGIARAVVNFRTMPGMNSEKVVEYVRGVIDDKAMELTYSSHGEPSEVSSVESPSFKRLEQAIREVYPNAVVAPNLTVASTDSKHYRILTSNIYRFLPVRFGPADLGRFHGTNERIGIRDYADGVRFYLRYLELVSL